MTIDTARRPITGITPLTVLCLALAGSAANAAAHPEVTPDRLAAARTICRDTMGLDPANAQHQQCVDSLLRNISAAHDRVMDPKGPAVPPAGGAQAACARFGLPPASDAFAGCAADLDATLFEAMHPTPG